jgi:hypothetical protein
LADVGVGRQDDAGCELTIRMKRADHRAGYIVMGSGGSWNQANSISDGNVPRPSSILISRRIFWEVYATEVCQVRSAELGAQLIVSHLAGGDR